jgi:hypothetical protein
MSDDGYSGAGQYPGSHKPVKGAPGPPVACNTEGELETPGIFYAPTARSKFREMRSELLAYAATIGRGKSKVGDPVELARIEGILDGLKLGSSKVDEAFELGRDSKSVAPTLRFCPDCPKGSTPLNKNSQFCPEHKKDRRKIQNRLAKRRQREKQNVSNVSKKVKVEADSVKGEKRRILKLMRTEGLTLREAAKAVGVTVGQAILWGIRDKEFGSAVKSLRLVSQIDFVLKWDDIVRSGRPLNPAEENCVYVARRLAANLEEQSKELEAAAPNP